MSIHSAKKFIERMKTDEDFAKKVIACKDSEERLAFVKMEGFDFTSAEITQKAGELSDEELERVSGGYICGQKWCSGDVLIR
ncbi:MAG: Nif11-like leader peptide family natural product precursor [Syntrophomonas sp.]